MTDIFALSTPSQVNGNWEKIALGKSRYEAKVFGLRVLFDVLQGRNGPYVSAFVVTPFLTTSFTVFMGGATTIRKFGDIEAGESFPETIRNGKLIGPGDNATVTMVRYIANVKDGFNELLVNFGALGTELLRIARTQGDKAEYTVIDHASTGVSYIPQEQRTRNGSQAGADIQFAD